MVLENTCCQNSVATDDGTRRSLESRQLSYQKLQQVDSNVGLNNKRCRQDSKACQESSSSRNNDQYGSWGPVYQNRANFNNMHLF